jgi:hypothetical protein
MMLLLLLLLCLRLRKRHWLGHAGAGAGAGPPCPAGGTVRAFSKAGQHCACLPAGCQHVLWPRLTVALSPVAQRGRWWGVLVHCRQYARCAAEVPPGRQATVVDGALVQVHNLKGPAAACLVLDHGSVGHDYAARKGCMVHVMNVMSPSGSSKHLHGQKD